MTRSPWVLFLAVGVLAIAPAALLACLWDYDTLKQERSRFPDTLELITGKFLRHSYEFYQWRIADRKARLEKDSTNLSLYDDLAVAYDKVGEHHKAIETILVKEKIRPGLYETEANLGTFYIHSGQAEKGLKHIERAIQINPDAHFGREKYQRFLVEYVLQRRKVRGDKLPLALAADGFKPGAEGKDSVSIEQTFAAFIWPQSRGEIAEVEERRAAIKGVLGILRFGKHDSPIVLEALGTLLLTTVGNREGEDAKRLAARAFLKASYEASAEEAKRGYRAMASNALRFQTQNPVDRGQLTLTELESDFKKELTEAEEWYAGVRDNEQIWIREEKNADEEFDRVYYADPAVSIAPETESSWTVSRVQVAAGVVVGLLVLFLVLINVLRHRGWGRVYAPKRQYIVRQWIDFDKGGAKDSPEHRHVQGGESWLVPTLAFGPILLT